MNRINLKNERGFTMIEILLVMAIIAIVTTFSAVFYSRFLTQNAVANAADQVAGQIQKARIYAMSGKQNSNWGVSFTSPILTLYSGASYAARNPSLDEKFRINSNVSVTGLLDLNIARATGVPGAVTTVTISAGNNIKTVTINSQGMTNR